MFCYFCYFSLLNPFGGPDNSPNQVYYILGTPIFPQEEPGELLWIMYNGGTLGAFEEGSPRT